MADVVVGAGLRRGTGVAVGRDHCPPALLALWLRPDAVRGVRRASIRICFGRSIEQRVLSRVRDNTRTKP